MRRLLCTLALVGLLAGCGGGSSSAGSDTPASVRTFTITGQVVVAAGDAGDIQGACLAGEERFNVSDDSQVIVASPAGRQIAVGRLSAGVGEELGDCRYRFTVRQVPEGFGLYSVTVTGLPGKTFPRARLDKSISFIKF